MKHAVIKIIVLYQHYISPDTGLLRFVYGVHGACRMDPSCSEYTKTAVEKYGVIIGLLKGGRRITRCHPFQKKLIDPV